MTTQDIIALAATIVDEAETLVKKPDDPVLGTKNLRHAERCRKLYLKLCGQAAGEALPDARVIAAALKVSEALGETDVTKIRVPSVLALALLNLERVVKRASSEELKQALKDVERHPVAPDTRRIYGLVRRANGKGVPCPTGDWEDVPPEEERTAFIEALTEAGLHTPELSFADTLAKKCDELEAENKRLESENHNLKGTLAHYKVAEGLR